MLGKHWLTCKDKHTGAPCIIQPSKSVILSWQLYDNPVFTQHINYFRYMDGLLPILTQANCDYCDRNKTVLYATNSAIFHGIIDKKDTGIPIIGNYKDINIWRL